MNCQSALFSRLNPAVNRPSNRPMVLGHRGIPEEHQENTLSGFGKAAELGIDGVELDVMLSKDDQLVVFHDDDAGRLTGHQGLISEINWQDLKHLEINESVDVGDRVIHYGQTERICLLQDVLEEIRGKLVVNIELKGKHPDTGKLVGTLLKKMSMEADVFVTSFHLKPLRSLRNSCPQMAAGFAFSEESDGWEALKQRFNRSYPGAKWVGASLSSMNIDMLSKETIEQHHRYGCAIGGWTFFAQDSRYFQGFSSEQAEIERIKYLQKSGVDFLITDQPVKLIEVLEGSGRSPSS